MTCPFAASHSQLGPEAAAKCPFAAALASSGISSAHAAETQPGVPTDAAGLAEQTVPLEKDEPNRGVCPLGFGSSRGPSLSALHCPLCRGLLFAACRTDPCQHVFCSSCISKFRDCPICGQDIEAITADDTLQGVVDTFLASHSQSPELVAAQTDLGPLPDHSPASFWLGQGLRSYAGGNLQAAISRLQQCRELLLNAAPGAATSSSSPTAPPAAAEPAAGASAVHGTSEPSCSSCKPSSLEAGHPVEAAAAAGACAHGPGSASSDKAGAAAAADVPPAPAQPPSGGPPQTASPHIHVQLQPLTATKLASRLGAVCGSLGDCWRRLNDLPTAEAMYLESICHLEPHADTDSDVWQALCISFSKLGDLKYMQHQLQEAQLMYGKVLQLREAALAAADAAAAAVADGPAAAAVQAPEPGAGVSSSSSSSIGEAVAEVSAAGAGTPVALAQDTVQSHLKVADVCQAAGDAASATHHLEAARRLLERVSSQGTGAPSLADRQQQLQKVMQQLLGTVTSSAAGAGPV